MGTGGGGFIKKDGSDIGIEGKDSFGIMRNVNTTVRPDGQVALLTTAVFPSNQPITLPEYEDILYRLRVTRPRQLFAGQWGFNGQPLVWSSQITGGASIEEPSTTGHNFIRFVTTGASGDKAVYQTQRYFQYQPSRNHSLTFAAALGQAATNKVVKIGLFDDSSTDGQNGWYVQRDQNGFEFVVASTASGSQNYIVRNRADWNVDKLDGTGPSGLNFTDAELGNVIIWNIDYSWYGASVVQFNIVYGSRRVVLHEETFSLRYSDHPFTKTAFLPLRLEVENIGASSPSKVTLGSISLDIENGEGEESGFQWSASTGTTQVPISTTGTTVFAVRPKLTVNGIENRGVLLPNNLSLSATGDCWVEVLIGGTSVGGAWTSVGPESLAEYSLDTTGYVGGRTIYETFVAAGGGNASGSLISSFPGDLFVAIDSLLGTQRSCAIRATRVGSATQVRTAVGWREIY